jgi:hypothetical protein
MNEQGVQLPQGYKLDQPSGAQPDAQKSKVQLPSGYTLDQTTKAPIKAPAKTWSDKIVGPGTTVFKKILRGEVDLAQGEFAGIASTVYHGGSLLRKVTGAKQIINEPDVQKSMTAPPSVLGKTGKVAEQVAEFFAPGELIEASAGILSKIPAVASWLGKGAEATRAIEAGARATGEMSSAIRKAKLVQGGIRAGLEATSAGGVSLAQNPEEKKRALVNAVVAGSATIAIPFLASGIAKTGEKIQQTLIKPLKGEMGQGFKIQNLNKYGIRGDLQKMLQQTEDQLDTLAKSLKSKIQSVKPKVNLVLKEQRPLLGTGAREMPPPAPPEGTTQTILDKAEIAPSVETGRFDEVRSSEDRLETTYTGENRNPEEVAGRLDAAKNAQLLEVINERARSSGLLKSVQDQAKRAGKPIPRQITDLYDVHVEGMVNVNDALAKTERELAGKNLTTVGFNKGISRALNSLKDDLAKSLPKGMADLSQAQQIKRSIGKLGSWLYQMSGQGPMRDWDPKAMEAVANSLYTHLRRSIEEAAPEGVHEVNKMISELIPIEHALVRRIPVAARNNTISLTDILTAIPGMENPANLWLFVLNRISKSGRIGGELTRLGKLIPTHTPAITRGITGTQAQIKKPKQEEDQFPEVPQR